jgi:anti-sigma regulatory factor (Ser/Thr protein kinase)
MLTHPFPVRAGLWSVAAMQRSLRAVARLEDDRRDALLSRAGEAGVGGSRFFSGRADQVGVVREFARRCLAGHTARDDAVLVASELAANAVAHSASGGAGGLFMVHVSVLSAGQAVVVVTDQGGPGRPCERGAGPDAEDGRGLAVVRALAVLVEFFEHGGLCSVLAVVGPAGDAVGDGAVGPSCCGGCGLALSRYNDGDWCGGCAGSDDRPGRAYAVTGDIGMRLRGWRMRRGMSLAVLAGLSGVSAPYLSMVENGQRGLNRWSTIVAVANALRVPPAVLALEPVPGRAAGQAGGGR